MLPKALVTKPSTVVTALELRGDTSIEDNDL